MGREGGAICRWRSRLRREASVVASSETRRSETTQTRRRTTGATEEEEIPSSTSHSQSLASHRSRFNALGLGQRVRGERESERPREP